MHSLEVFLTAIQNYLQSYLRFTQLSWYSCVHEVFTVVYVVDVFIIFQHIIQPLKIKKVVDA